MRPEIPLLLCAALFFVAACVCIRALVLRLDWEWWLILLLAVIGFAIPSVLLAYLVRAS